MQQNQVHQVWIAMSLREESQLEKVLFDLRHVTADIRYIPDILGFRLLNHSISNVLDLPVVNISATPMDDFNRLIKAFEDRFLAFLILLLVFPLMLIIAIGIKLTSRGPVLFKQMRHGWDGRPIKVYKFRTMIYQQENAEAMIQATRPGCESDAVWGIST